MQRVADKQAMHPHTKIYKNMQWLDHDETETTLKV
jgi:hypothetical protein